MNWSGDITASNRKTDFLGEQMIKELRFRSARVVVSSEQAAIEQLLLEQCIRYSWIGTDVPGFFNRDENRLVGRSTEAIGASQPDGTAYKLSRLPGGSLQTVFEILCRLSCEFELDWELSYGRDSDFNFRITDGVGDSQLVELLELAGRDLE